MNRIMMLILPTHEVVCMKSAEAEFILVV
jgi:hypothetical protein